MENSFGFLSREHLLAGTANMLATRIWDNYRI